MSSEQLGAAQNVLKGNLGGAWDITNGYQDAYTDLGIARRFGGAAAAYSLRDIGAMNGRVVKVRRSGDDVEEDFSASQVQSGALENWVNGNLDSTLPADVATSAGAYSLRKASSLKTIYNQSSFPNTDVSPLVKNMTYNSFAGNVDGYQGKDNLIKLEMDASDGAGGPDIPRTPQVALGSDSYKSSRTGTVTFEYYIESDSPLVGGYWIVGNESNQYSPEGVKIIGGAWTTAVVQFKDKTGSSTNTVYSDQGRLLSIRDASVGGQAIKINRDDTNPFIHFSSFLVTATDFSLVRIRRSSDNIEVNVGFDEDEKVSLNSLVGNVNEEGGDIGITNATDLNGFLNANEQTVGSAANGTGSVDFNSFSGNSNTGFTVTNSDAGTFKQAVFPYGSGEGDVIVANFDLNVTSGSPTIQVRTGAAIGTVTAKSNDATVSSSTNHTITLTCTGDGLYIKFLESDACTFTVSNFSIVSHTQGATVHTWYDQAGSNNAVEATAANQPKIASSGTLLSGINFDGNTFLNIAADLMNGTDGTTFMVASNIDTDQETFYLSNRDGGTGFHFKNDTSHKGKLSYNFIGSNAQISTNAVVPDSSDNKQLFGFVKDSNDTELFNNALQLADGTASQTYSASSGANTSIGKQGNSSSAGANKTLVVYELISYDSDQSNNRFKIESNINNYYGLYNDENEVTGAFTASGQDSFTANGTDGFTLGSATANAFAGIELNEKVPDNDIIYISFNADLSVSGTATPTVELRKTSISGTLSSDSPNSGQPAVIQGFNSFALVSDDADAKFVTFTEGDDNVTFTVSDFKVSRIERNGYVYTWYNQNGGGFNLNQDTDSNQPEIVLNGGQVKLNGGSPCIAGSRRPTNLRREFDATSDANAITQPFTNFQIVNSRRNASGYIWADNATSSGGGPRLEMKKTLLRQTYSGTDNPAGISIDGDVDQVISVFSAAASGNAIMRRNSTQLQSAARSVYDDTDNVGGIFRFPGDDSNLQNMILLETLVFYNGDLSADFEVIERELARPVGIDI